MPSVIDWTSLGGEMDKGSQGGVSGDRVPFLKFQQDKIHVFRPVGKAVRFYKTFVNKKPLIIDLEHKAAAEKILSDVAGDEIKLQNRFAMFIIDREDGEVKILEGNYKMMEAFANWSAATSFSPGAKEGGDWSISVSGSGFGGPNPRRYQTGFLRSSVITPEELATLTSMKDNDMLNLEDIFVAVPLEKLAEKATGQSSGATTQAASVTSTSATASTAASNPLW